MRNSDSKKNPVRSSQSPSSTGPSGAESTEGEGTLLQQYHENFGNSELQGLVGGDPIGGVQSLLVGDIGAEIAGMSLSAMDSNTEVATSMDLVARKRSAQSSSPQNASEKVKTVLQRSGRSLPSQLQRALESKYGADLSNVRIHTGNQADAAAKSVQAQAFASGTNIAFASGKYDPSSESGKELIAHEVAHVVQHLEGRIGTGSETVNGVSVTAGSDAVELEADSMARDFMVDSVVGEAEAGGADVRSASGASAAGVLLRRVDPSLVQEQVEADEAQKGPSPEQQSAEAAEQEGEQQRSQGKLDAALEQQSEQPESPSEAEQSAPAEEQQSEVEQEASQTEPEGTPAENADGSAPMDGEPAAGSDAPAEGASGAQAADPSSQLPPAPVLSEAVSFAPTPMMKVDPPKMDPKRADKFKKETGIGPKEAFSRVESQVDRVASLGQGFKESLQTEIHSIESSIASMVLSQQSVLTSAAATARGQISTVFDASKEMLSAICLTSMNNLSQQIDSQRAALDTLRAGKQGELETAFVQVQQQLETVRGSAPAELNSHIDSMGELFDTAFMNTLPQLQQMVSNSLQQLPSGGFEEEFEAHFIKEALNTQHKTLDQATEQQKNQYRDATLDVFRAQSQAMVDSVLVPLQQTLQIQHAQLYMGIEQSMLFADRSLASEKANMRSNLTTAQQENENSIEGSKEASLALISSSEERGVTQVEHAGTQILSTLRDSARGFGDVYDSQMHQLHQILERVSNSPDDSEAEAQIALIRTKMEAAYQRHQSVLSTLREGASTQLAEMATTLSEQVNSMASQGSAHLQQLADSGRMGIEAQAAQIAQQTQSLGQSISGQIESFTQAMEVRAQEAEARSVTLLEQERAGIDQQLQEAAGQQQQFLSSNVERQIQHSRTSGSGSARSKRKSLSTKASELFNAMDGWGTDEDAIFTTLRGLSSLEGRMLRNIYADHYKGMSLTAHLRDELNDEDYARASAALQGNRVQATLLTLEGSIGFWNDDEATIKAELRSLSSEELMQLHQELKNNPEARAIIEDVRDNLGGEDLDIFNTFVEADVDGSGNVLMPDAAARNIRADAIEMYHAMDGWGTNEQKVYAGLEGKTQEELQQVQAAYLTYAQEENAQSSGGNRRRRRNKPVLSLEEKIQSEFEYTGDGDRGNNYEGDIALGLLKGDDVAVRAARLEEASDGWFFGAGTDEKAILSNLKADMPDRPDPSDPEYEQKYQAYTKAQDERAALNQMYEERYGRTIESMLDSELGRNQERDPMRRLAQQTLDNGDGDRVTKVEAAIDGWGTDEDLLKEAFTDKGGNALSQDEIQTLLDELGPEGVDDVLSDVGGKDQLDIEVLMLGKPETPADYQRIADMKYDFQRSGFSGWFVDGMSHLGMTRSGEMLDHQKERLDGQLESWEESGTQNVPRDVEHVFEYFNQDFESYEAAKNEIANTTGTALSVVGSIALVVATGGGAAPVLVGLLTSAGMSATAATVTATAIGTFGTAMAGSLAKGAIRGNSYSGEDFATDVGAATMWAVLSGGGAYIKHLAAGGQTHRLLDPLIRVQGTANTLKESDQLIIKIGGAVLEDLPTNLISTSFYTLTNESNWDNDTLLQNFVTGMLSRSGGVALGTVAGHYGGKAMGSFTTGAPQNLDDPAQGFFNEMLSDSKHGSRLISLLSNSHVQAQYNTAVSKIAYNFGNKATKELLTYLSDPVAYDKDLLPLLGDMFTSSTVGAIQVMLKSIPSTMAANRNESYADLKTAVASGDKEGIMTAMSTFSKAQQERMVYSAVSSVLTTTEVSATEVPSVQTVGSAEE